jgi:M-phase phosphoprotein-6
MQRSSLKVEKKKADEEEPNGSFPSLRTVAKKCVVITDWDPQPGALLGRMSFQSFNPSIEKLHEEAINGGNPSSSSSNGGKKSFRSVLLLLYSFLCYFQRVCIQQNNAGDLLSY